MHEQDQSAYLRRPVGVGHERGGQLRLVVTYRISDKPSRCN